MLVNIYGSKELFVNEYKTLLADRILSNFNFEIGREIRYLELLKLRFGESQLHNCEVMLKDVADSKRINTRIAEERKKTGEAEVPFIFGYKTLFPFQNKILDLAYKIGIVLEGKSFFTAEFHETDADILDHHSDAKTMPNTMEIT